MAAVPGPLQDMFRRSNKSVKALELLWRGAKSYGASADVFTGNFASGARMPLLCWAPACNNLRQDSAFPVFTCEGYMGTCIMLILCLPMPPNLCVQYVIC